MATLPSARTTVTDTAGAQAAGLDLCCVIAPCASADPYEPRLYGNADAIYQDHGYSEGVEYSALHFARTRKSVLFVAIPIATAGAVGRQNTSGNTGTSVTTVSAGANGVLREHEGRVRVKTGGTIGTDQIVIEYSLDGGINWKPHRLGTGNSFTVPYIGVTVAFGAGTLVAGDVIHEWFGSGPRGDATGWANARTALAAGDRLFRSALVTGDMQTDTEANALATQFNNYETANERFTVVRASVLDRLPQAELSHVAARMTGNPSLTFAEVGATGDTITRSAGSWVTDGFSVNDTVTVTGSASNNVTGVVTAVTATVLTFGTTDLAAEGPVSNVTVTAVPTLTFAEVGATGDTLTRSRGSWLDDGFRVADVVTVAGTASNNVSGAVTAVTATVLTFNTTDLAAEVVGASSTVTVTAGQTKAAWMAAIDAEFASVAAEKRINLAAGRGRETAEFANTGWEFRCSPAWAASLREYQHDIHITTWRKRDGGTGFDLFDANGNLAEWDDRVDGGAGVAARFTVFRTYANGPAKQAFIALDLTRAGDASLLSYHHNIHVVNLACSINQAATEDFIGRSLVLNDDGTAATDALNTLQNEVNLALERALLSNVRGEGQRASKAVWTPSADDVLNVPEATLTGVLELNLNGTIHSVRTTVRVA